MQGPWAVHGSLGKAHACCAAWGDHIQEAMHAWTATACRNVRMLTAWSLPPQVLYEEHLKQLKKAGAW
jgi:hypothetical protein